MRRSFLLYANYKDMRSLVSVIVICFLESIIANLAPFKS